MKEERRCIPGYELLYQISDFGRVKRSSNNKSMTEKILKPYIYLDGYLRIKLRKNGKCKTQRIHRLVASAFLGLDLSKGRDECALHKNDIRSDNRLENLFIGTYKDNTKDMINKGRDNMFGGKINIERYRKISIEQAEEIKKLYYRGISNKEKEIISKRYGISFSHTKKIMYNLHKSYKK